MLFALATGCNIYGPALLEGDGGVDAPAEACPMTCNGKCVDTQTDKNNCGACGKTCETGCSAGFCTPTLLVGSLGAPHGILVNGSSLYVANNGSINLQVMSKIDGTGLKNFATSQLLPDRLAASSTTLYWTNNSNSPHPAGGQLDEEALDGTTFCNTQTNSLFCYLAQDLPGPYGIAVQGDTIFMTMTGATNNAGNGCAPDAWASSVLSCSASFGCATVGCAASGGPTVLASGQTALASIAADATNVYWADTGAHVVRFCPQPNCGTPQTFAQLGSTSAPFDVVSDGTTVYMTDRSGSVYACPKSGCAGNPTLLASGIDDPLLLAVDSAAVFVTSYAGHVAGKGSILGCALPCAKGMTTIAANLKGPYGIALDSTYVYWSEEGSAGTSSKDGAVQKIKRPF